MNVKYKQIVMEILTQMSNLPGKSLSGILAAQRDAPTMYRTAMRISQPRAPTLKALQPPKMILQWMAGMTPLRPRAMNMPARMARNSGSRNLSHMETTMQEIPSMPINIRQTTLGTDSQQKAQQSHGMKEPMVKMEMPQQSILERETKLF